MAAEQRPDDAPGLSMLTEGVPTLPPDATHEEREAHWRKHVYQGDRMPQLTLRAVAMGGILGMLMSASNLYTALKVGWLFGVAITACVMSYVIWNVLRIFSGGRLSKMSILENACMESTASAAGYSTGATMATMFGALLILEGEKAGMNLKTWDVMPVYAVALFVLFTAALGVFVAVPTKRQMINVENLPFPSGIAAAETLRSLYSEGKEAMQKAYSLIIALLAGVFIGIINTGEGTLAFLDRAMNAIKAAIFDIRLPELVPETGLYKVAQNGQIADKGGLQLPGFGFEPSGLLIAAGMIVGLRVSITMIVGSCLLYFFVGPWLIGLDGAAGFEPNIHSVTSPINPDLVRSVKTNGGGQFFQIVHWSLWGGTALMVFSSLASVALQWRTVGRAFSGIFEKRGPAPGRGADSVEVPVGWLIGGLIPISIGMILVQWLAFDIAPWLGVIAIAMAFVLSMVASRATGETDTTPMGAMGKVMQLLFGVLSPGNVVHNLASAGVAANSASASADLLTDMKTGYLLGANPRKQFIAQFIGVFFGTLAVVPAWYLMVPDKAALEKYPLPSTQQWVAVARLLTEGVHNLPLSARWAILIGALLGVAMPLIERALPRGARKFFPSAMGLGLSWIMPFANSLAFAIGAVLAWMWSLASRKAAEKYTIPVSSGLIAGEGMIKAIIAMTATVVDLTSSKP